LTGPDLTDIFAAGGTQIEARRMRFHIKGMAVTTARITWLLLCAGSGAFAQFAGEIYSLDFESGLGWSKSDNTNVEMRIDRRVVHWGEASLRMSGPAKTWQENYGALNGGGIPLSPNTEYVLVYWARGEDVFSKRGQMVIMNKPVQQIGTGGMDWKTAVYRMAAYPQGTYDWRKVEYRFKTSVVQDTTFTSILFQNGGGAVWLDDIRLMTAEAYKRQQEFSAMLETEIQRRRFVPGEEVPVLARLRNNRLTPAAVEVEAALYDGDRKLAGGRWVGRLGIGETSRAELFEWDTSRYRNGDYQVKGRARLEGAEATQELSLDLKLCPKVQPGFFWSMWAPSFGDETRTQERLERLKPYHLAPTFGDLRPSAMDMCLEYGLPFSARLHSHAHKWNALSGRRGIKGEGWPDNWKKGQVNMNFLGLSHPGLWVDAGRNMEALARTAAQYPAFSGHFTTSDDFSTRGGWDWSDWNRRRFREIYGMDAPEPEAFKKSKPPYYDTWNALAQRPKGIVQEDDPWLLWSRFLTLDVAGRYNNALRQGMERGAPGSRIGPVPGGMQWPLLQLCNGQYPPHNFGRFGFNLASYYYYLIYWQPAIGHVYWSEIARMGARDLPVWCLADSMFLQRHYHRNNFFLLLAGGVRGISYFTYGQTSDEFWEEGKALSKIVHENGALFDRLRPARRSVGFLMPFTAVCFNQTYPISALYAYGNLLSAHVDAEPVAEEEILSSRLDQYETIVLSDVDWLTPGVVRRLEDFVLRGRRVVVDSATEVPIEGATRLPFCIGTGKDTPVGWIGDYGQAEVVAKVRRAFEGISKPWLDSTDHRLVLRAFEAGGARYAWAVNITERPEYRMLRRSKLGWPGEEKLTREEYLAYEKKMNFNAGVYRTKIAVGADDGVVYDVLTGQPVLAEKTENRSELPIVMPRLGGTLLMFVPRPIAKLELTAPVSVKTGGVVPVTIRLKDGAGELVPGVIPIELGIRGATGSQLRTEHVVATNGEFQRELIVPVNEIAKQWSITASTRFLKDDSQTVKVQIQ
jgi:hypothetical protein